MKNSSIYRSNLSNEKIAFLSAIRKELNNDDYTPKTYKRQENEEDKHKNKEIDLLWQSFKTNVKEEKSPGVYLLTGFIAGALCMFVMNSLLSISSNISSTEPNPSAMGQPKFEKKISRKEKLPQINANSSVAVVPAETETVKSTAPKSETYTVKSGDSMSSIVYRFYGKYDIDKVEKIKQVNNLSSVSRLSVGQQLVIPLN